MADSPLADILTAVVDRLDATLDIPVHHAGSQVAPGEYVSIQMVDSQGDEDLKGTVQHQTIFSVKYHVEFPEGQVQPLQALNGINNALSALETALDIGTDHRVQYQREPDVTPQKYPMGDGFTAYDAVARYVIRTEPLTT